MSTQTRFLNFLLHRGTTATVNQVSGTACPCMTWRDANRPEYSAEYHRTYPAAAHCNGTGSINTSTTSTSVKLIQFSVQAMTSSGLISKETASQIGELQKTDVLVYGTVNASTGMIFDLSTLTEKEDTIRLNSVTYRVRHVWNLPFFDEEKMAQIAVLKRDA